jgi:hypothetical protein
MNGNRNVLGMLSAISWVAMVLSAAVAVGTALGPAWGWGALSAMCLVELALIAVAVGDDRL